MKIHGLMLVKDEADVVGEVLRRAAEWCDGIYIFDNGSTDGSWEIVQALARELPAVIPWTQDDRPYTNRIRGEIFEAFRDRGQPGDWWCKLDADEIYVDHPWRFLARVPKRCKIVYGASFQYYFTDRDLERYEQDPALYDASRPIEERLRWYANNYSEPRFARDDGDANWSTGNPEGGAVYPIRIWLKHFQYRSPEQIQRRVESRVRIANLGQNFQHERAEDWRARIRPAAELSYDAHDGRLDYREDRMKRLPGPSLRDDLVDVAGRIARTGRRRLGLDAPPEPIRIR